MRKLNQNLKNTKAFSTVRPSVRGGRRVEQKTKKKKKERKNREKNNRRGELTEEDFGEEISKWAYRIFTINARHLLNAGLEKTPASKKRRVQTADF